MSDILGEQQEEMAVASVLSQSEENGRLLRAHFAAQRAERAKWQRDSERSRVANENDRARLVKERDEALSRAEAAEADNAALLGGFKDAFAAMEHCADTLNAMDAVDEEEDREAMEQVERANEVAEAIHRRDHPGAALLEELRRLRMLQVCVEKYFDPGTGFGNYGLQRALEASRG